MTQNSTEHYQLVSSKTCREILTRHPDYKVFWRSGFAYRGAGEREDDKGIQKDFRGETTFEERMNRRYDWAAALDIDVNHAVKEIHINGFSENDLY